MHKRVSPLQKKLLILLFKGGRELDSFTLFKRAKIGFSEFTVSISSLIELHLVGEEETRLRLLDEGADLVLQGGAGLGDKAWRQVPDEYVVQRIPPNQPYTPSVRLLDRRTFKNLKIDVD